MKNILIILLAVLFLGFTAAGASASSYEFEDMLLFDDGYIGSGDPLFYQHDITSKVDFAAGDYVTNATLELTFNDDEGDCFRLGWTLGGFFLQDNHEFVVVGLDLDNGTWTKITSLGEVDSGQYDLVIGAESLNDDGILEVGIGVWNFTSSADIWLESSYLYGNANGNAIETSTLPVPEPSTFLLLGAGVLVLVGTGRSRFLKR